MSLEQALAENTAAINALAAIVKTISLAPVVVAEPAPAPAVETKPIKVTKAAKPATETAPAPAEATRATVAETPAGEPVEGDAAGTRYFVNTKHNTTFRILPTDPLVIPADSKEVSGADFLALQPAPASGPASAESSTTATVEQPVAIDFKTMMEKMRELHAIGGNAALAPILLAVKADKIGTIAEDKRREAYDLTVKALAAAGK